MQLQELISKCKQIRDMGFVESKRSGNTGVGYTFEQLLGITENNDSGSDIENLGLEIKAQRKGTSSKNTNFTQAPLWILPLEKIIKKYGIEDINAKRINFYQDFSFKENNLGLKLSFEDDTMFLVDASTSEKLFSIHIEVLKHRFSQKLKNVLFVYAESKKLDGKEYFHFNEFKIRKDLDVSKIKQLLINGVIKISFRSYIDCSTNTIRDRGLAYRTEKSKLNCLFNTIEEI